jgi:hypothetical protein
MRVGEEWRINSLSVKPGGYVVTIIYKNGFKLEYDKIKSPEAYISKIKDLSEISEIQVDGKKFWKHTLK